ncbi:MAG: acyl-CoA dehydrogenase, partial [Candidatus Competibacterales bacterium]|nr:acyl-CoA dehydrogenase [Candidatus Competibacterales bacterium]
SEREQAFLDGPVEELCRQLDDWEVAFEHHDLPQPVWRFLAEQGFFGLIIPREYGGLGFSAQAHSAVIVKIASRCGAAAVTVMVPNSLGPAELLLAHGTEAQRAHYLPRLADGRDIPCFAMTGPEAGSDAAAMPDRGVVCRQVIDGEQRLGFRVDWEKRYITLAPVATVMGLAFHAHDPEGLLGGEEDLGITLALVPTDTPGVEIGMRHLPCRQAFQNGPTWGREVFVPLDWVIGGADQVGQGWRMLMESLSAGRSISLPSLAAGAAQLAACSAGAYARVRRQFGVPIARFEGVQEALAPVAANAYLVEALRRTSAILVDQGEKPAVLSAIAKYHATTRLREALNLALDVQGGKTVIDGPGNVLSSLYYAIPVVITVEGANILTRSLIVFGQGAIRCHPYLLEEMLAASAPEQAGALERFDRALFGHVRFVLGLLPVAAWRSWTGGRFTRAPVSGPEARHYRRLQRYSAAFALVAEAALVILGGTLKKREALSGRLGDVLAELYLLSCCLKRFRDEGRPEADRPLLDWLAARGFRIMEERLDAVLRHFPARPLAWLLRILLLPWGRREREPHDRLTRQVAAAVSDAGDSRRRLTAGVYRGEDGQPLAELEQALEASIAAEALDGHDPARLDPAQRALRERAEALRRRVIAVDAFAADYLEVRHRDREPRHRTV